MRNLPFWLTSSVAAAALLSPLAAQAKPYAFHYDHVLGTSLDITVMADSEAAALAAAGAARAEIDRLDPILSAWRPDSELSRLNASTAAQVSPELYQVLARCEAWRKTTEGAFDCRLGEPLRLWRAADGWEFTESRLESALEAARAEATLTPLGHRVERPEGVVFTVDGLAKGYVIDRAMQAAKAAGPRLSGLMIDIGGDLRCWGRSPEAGGWRVGVAETGAADNALPPTLLRVGDRAVAASGLGERDLRVEGCAAAHVLSPVSGRPTPHARRAVVAARTAADADALSTAFMAMPADRAMALAERLDGVEALVTDAEGVRHVSSGWSLLESPLPAHTRQAGYYRAGAGAPATAQQAFDLELGYQVPKIDADPYHAPYVAVWVTDAEHKLVRELLLLGQKPRWAPENYVWWRRYGRNTPALLDTLAKPTRLPGRYSVKWDGKDDAGQAAAPGRYILHIEASREKGGHTYQTVEFDVGGQAGSKTLPAKDEMGALDLRYGPAH